MKYFSIHNIVGIEVYDNYKWADTLIVNIPMFETNENGFKKCPSKITIKYNKKVEIKDAYEVVPYIFIDRINNKIFDKKYGALIEITNSTIDITVTQECNEWMMMMLEYSLLKNKCTFMHSAGVEKDGFAYIFPSWGGVGKTASVAKLVRENGYKLLGDDLVILSETGDVYAFPKKFVLYAYHRNLFSDAMKNKKLINGNVSKLVSKFIPLIKSILRKIPGLLAFARRHNPQSKRVSPYEIFGEDKIAITGKIKKFTWLERIYVSKTRTEKITLNQISARALLITIHELYDGRLQEFFIGLCAGLFDFEIVFNDSVKFITKTLKDVEVNQLFIPVDYPIENVASDVVEYTIK